MALRLLARAARGSMRDALSLTDQAIAFGGGPAAGGQRAPGCWCGRPQPYVALIAALAAGDGGTVVETVETLRVNGLQRRLDAGEMTGVLQRMAVAQQVPQALSITDDPGRPRRCAWRRRCRPTRPAVLYSLCLHGRGELGLGARRVRRADHGAAATAGLKTGWRG